VNIEGIDRITYGVEDIAACKRFFLDWGLRLVGENDAGLDFESLNGCEVNIRKADDPSLPRAMEPGPTLREVIWGVTGEADLEALRASLSRQTDFQ
jgi:catechol 2,3-dioxygenase-like lactoylglutathione lyase family enzyme